MSGGNHHGPSNYRKPRSVADVTRENVQAMHKLDELAVAQRSFADRVAAFVARFCGSIAFVWIHVLLFAAWIVWNALPGLPHVVALLDFMFERPAAKDVLRGRTFVRTLH